jgi:hypothetical protein
VVEHGQVHGALFHAVIPRPDLDADLQGTRPRESLVLPPVLLEQLQQTGKGVWAQGMEGKTSVVQWQAWLRRL